MRAQISQHAHRITCWSPLWGAGPLSGALLGDGASWSAPLPCKATPHVPRHGASPTSASVHLGVGWCAKQAPPGGRWSGRDTSCGTVVLQCSLDQTGGPRRQRSTRVGLFSASGSCWHEPLLQLWIFSVANLFLPRFELGSKLLLVGVSRFWEAGRSCLCRRASRSVSRSRTL